MADDPPADQPANEQFLLDLRHTPSLSRDDLVTGDPNLEAVALVDAWPQWPSPFAIIVGPPGSGKTHVAHIWAQESGALMLDPARLTAGEGFDLGHHDAILIDGIEPGGFDETGLFHVMNAVRAAKAYLLMTSRVWPGAWLVHTPDLISRLRSAMIIEMGEPDDALLRAVLLKLFSDRQLVVGGSTVDYIIVRMERSLATAIKIVERLDAHSLAEKKPITRAFAATVLSDMGMQ